MIDKLKIIVDKIFNQHMSIFTNAGHRLALESENRRWRHKYWKRPWADRWHLREIVRVR